MNNFEKRLRKSNLEGVKVTLGEQEISTLVTLGKREISTLDIPSYVVIITPRDVDIKDVLDIDLVIETFKHDGVRAVEFHDGFNQYMGKKNRQRIRKPLTTSDSPVFRYYYPISHYKKRDLLKIIGEVIQSLGNGER